MRLWLCAAFFAALLFVGDIAFAAGRRIVLVDADDVFTSAVFASLAGWEAEVVGVNAPLPEGDESAFGRAFAARHGADAIAWIRTSASETPQLVIFDADSNRVVHRPVDRAPPFDEARAAAVALTIKTVLRTTRIAPVAERTPPTSEPAPVRTAPASPPPAPAPRPVAAWVEADGGVARSPASELEARGGLALAIWPDPRIGGALRMSGGTGASVKNGELDATFMDLSLSLAARTRVPLGSVLGLELGAGGAIHAARLTGTVIRHAADVSVSRVDPSVDGTVAFDVALGARTKLALAGSASWFTRSQRYLVGGIEALDLSPFVASGALRIGVRID